MVSIDGRNMGTYPLPGALPVNAGNVDIEVSKSGCKRALRSITIAGGHYQRLLIRLEETDKVPDSVVSAEPLSVGTPDAAQDSIASTPAADAAEPRPIYRDIGRRRDKTSVMRNLRRGLLKRLRGTG